MMTRRRMCGLPYITCIHLPEKAPHTVCPQWACLASGTMGTYSGTRSFGCIHRCWCFTLKLRNHCLNTAISDLKLRDRMHSLTATKAQCFPGNHPMLEVKIRRYGLLPDPFSITSADAWAGLFG